MPTIFVVDLMKAKVGVKLATCWMIVLPDVCLPGIVVPDSSSTKALRTRGRPSDLRRGRSSFVVALMKFGIHIGREEALLPS